MKNNNTNNTIGVNTITTEVTDSTNINIINNIKEETTMKNNNTNIPTLKETTDSYRSIMELYVYDLIFFKTREVIENLDNFKTAYEIVEEILDDEFISLINCLPLNITGFNSMSDMDVYIEDIYNECSEQIILILKNTEKGRKLIAQDIVSDNAKTNTTDITDIDNIKEETNMNNNTIEATDITTVTTTPTDPADTAITATDTTTTDINTITTEVTDSTNIKEETNMNNNTIEATDITNINTAEVAEPIFYTLEAIISLAREIVHNGITFRNILAHFGGEENFDAEAFLIATSNPETLKEIKGIGNIISNKLARAFENVILVKTITAPDTKAAIDDATSKKTFIINTFKAITEEVKQDFHFTNIAFRYAISKKFNPENEFLFVDLTVERDLSGNKDLKQQAEVDNYIKNGIVLNGKLYVTLATTSSGAKQALTIFCIAEHAKLYRKFFRHGLTINGIRMEPNKYFTRLGLAFTSSTSFKEVFPNTNPIKNKLHILKDVYRNGKNVSDGASFYFDKEKRLPAYAASLRPLKSLCVPVNKGVFLKELGCDYVGRTAFNNLFCISNSQLIAFESTAKFLSLSKTEEEYIDGIFDELSVAVKMNKHQTKNLVYQPLQTLQFSKESIDALTERSVEYLNSLKEFDNYLKLIPGKIRRCAAIYPGIIKDTYVSKIAAQAYRKEKMTCRGGAVPACGKFHAICPDIIDIFAEGKKGLKAGECCLRSMPEGYITVIRYPHTSAASFVHLYNRHVTKCIKDKNVLMLNNYDDSLRRLGGADYDGDKVLVVTDKVVDEIITKTLEEMGNPTEMPNTPAGHANKVLFSKENVDAIVFKYFSNLTDKSNIGCVSNRLSAAYANLFDALATGNEQAIKDANASIDYWLQMVEITVDKEKHGSTYIPEPTAVKNMNKSLPMFMKLSKIAKHMNSKKKNEQIDDSKYARRENSPLEIYSEKVNAETCEMKEFRCNSDIEFDYHKLMFGNTTPSYIENSKWFRRGEPKVDDLGRPVLDERGKQVYMNQGLYTRIVFANTNTLREYADKVGIDYRGLTLNELRTKLIEYVMMTYAIKYDISIEDTYDILVFVTYTYDDENFKRCFWDCLSEYAERALTENLGKIADDEMAALNIDDEDDDDEDEEDLDI